MDAITPATVHVLIRAVSHPAMRHTAAYIANVLTAGESSVVCMLDVSLDPIDYADGVEIYLRPAATDALALTLTAELAGTPRLLAACTAMAAHDESCREMFCLSWEGLLADPHGTLQMLADHLQIHLPGKAWRIVDRDIASLRSDVDRYDHPIAFVAALDGAPPESAWTDNGLCADDDGKDVSHLLAPTAPRSMLVVTQTGQEIRAVPIEDSAEWQISHFVVDGEVAATAIDAAAKWGVIYLHTLETASTTGSLLDNLVPCLAEGGLLCGDEVSDVAVARVLAKLTGDGDRHELTFMLAGRRWFAIRPAWYR